MSDRLDPHTSRSPGGMLSHARSILLERLRHLNNLPRLPVVFFRIEQLVRDQSTVAQELADVIETDPAAVAQILRMANSTRYRPTGAPLSSIREAVVRLGFQEVRRLCVLSCMLRTFVHNSGRFDTAGFWRHSYAVGTLARRLVLQARLGDESESEVAFTAGLLHDVGLLVLDQFFDVLYSIVQREIRRSGRSTEEMEHLYLQVDHGEIGGELLRRWNLPETLVVPISFHHRVDECPPEHQKMASIVGLAEQIMILVGQPGPGELVSDRRDWSVASCLGLTPEDIDHWLEAAQHDAASAVQLLAG